MINERELFYQNTVRDMIGDKQASILVCGGGPLDKGVFERLGFSRVTISNLDSRMVGNEYAPFDWKYENAEALSFAEGAFDYVVIHAAIHHASSPHRVLTEMYRVAKKGVLAFESRDSLLMQLAEKSGVAQTYEHAAVYYNDCKYGGVNNTDIPNYVYRWTEREVEKTIQTYAPSCKHKFIFKYGSAFPSTPELETKGALKKNLLKIARPAFCVFAKLFPKQQNLFAFYIEKPVLSEALWPWLVFNKEQGTVAFNRAWGDMKYKSAAPKGDQ